MSEIWLIRLVVAAGVSKRAHLQSIRQTLCIDGSLCGAEPSVFNKRISLAVGLLADDIVGL